MLALIALFGGFLGAVHPIGDSLSAFRFWLCGAVVALILISQRSRLRRLAMVGTVPVVLLLAVAYVPVRAGPNDAQTLKVYQKNMLWNGQGREALFRDIIDSGADIVTLQEVNPRNHAALAALSSHFPHQQYCPHKFVGGTMVLSKFPVRARLDCRRGLSAMQVQAPGGAVWVVAVHLSWPYPYDQVGHAADMLAALRGIDGAMIMAGDFNMAPWGSAVRQLFRGLGLNRVGPVRGSYDLFGFLPLPLDHVHTTGQGHVVSVRPFLGADHRGLLAEVAY